MTPRPPFHWSDRPDPVSRWVWFVLMAACVAMAGAISLVFR